MIVAERLRSLVENYFSKSSGSNPVESSAVNIGIAEYPSDADSIELLINQAVEALFKSKREYYARVLKN